MIFSANILTVNQNIPVMGAALVSISARVDTVKFRWIFCWIP